MAQFSRKNYLFAANIIKENLEKASKEHGETGWSKYDALKVLSSCFAKRFKQDNPNFDEVKFFRACGFEE